MNYNAIMKKWYENDKTLLKAPNTKSSNTIYNNTQKYRRRMKQPNALINVHRRRVGNNEGMHMYIYIIINVFLFIQG